MKARLFLVVACCTLALLFTACQTDPKESKEYKDLKAELDQIKGGDSLEAANIEVYKKIIQVNDSTEIDQLGDYFAADFTFHDMPEGLPQGLESFKGLIKGYVISIPNMQQEIKHIMAEGDLIIAHTTMSGVNSGASMDMPATGKSIKVDAYDCMRFKDGKVIEYWGVADVMKMMTQMGLMPEMGGE